MFLSQNKYATQVLEHADMLTCNPWRTLFDTDFKLGINGDLVSDSTLNPSLVSALHYLTFTKPNVSYVVEHGMLDYGLQLFSSLTSSLVAYSTTDWAGFPTTCRSTSGIGVANTIVET
ncbi:ribonuclease H-like domain-containing protein [Tanacetum coccineum]